MPTRTEFQQISFKRLEEAKILYGNNCFDGAVYLSGYVIEAALKARICLILDMDYPEKGDEFRSFKTHKYDVLVKLAGLDKVLNEEKRKNLKFSMNWSLISDENSGWTESYRYNSIGTTNKNEAEKIINAIEDVQDGILTWLEKRW